MHLKISTETHDEALEKTKRHIAENKNSSEYICVKKEEESSALTLETFF